MPNGITHRIIESDGREQQEYELRVPPTVEKQRSGSQPQRSQAMAVASNPEEPEKNDRKIEKDEFVGDK
jgi:hypothetical protein